jgi:hypothetical protein
MHGEAWAFDQGHTSRQHAVAPASFLTQSVILDELFVILGRAFRHLRAHFRHPRDRPDDQLP